MKLIDELLRLAQTTQQENRPLLKAVAQKLEDQRRWREAWLNAESKVELLTSELKVIKSKLQHRKKKEDND
jgi:hypothetical protein